MAAITVECDPARTGQRLRWRSYCGALGYAVLFVETCGALVVLVGVLRAAIGFGRQAFVHALAEMTTLRLQLGQCLVMGLEFQVAADILRTALSPSWNDILLLASLVGLRTILNYFLERELEMLGKRRDVG